MTCVVPTLMPFDVRLTFVKSGDLKNRDFTEAVSLHPGWRGSSTAPFEKWTTSTTGTNVTVVEAGASVGSVPTIWNVYVWPSSGDMTVFWKNGMVVPAIACSPSVA